MWPTRRNQYVTSDVSRTEQRSDQGFWTFQEKVRQNERTAAYTSQPNGFSPHVGPDTVRVTGPMRENVPFQVSESEALGVREVTDEVPSLATVGPQGR